MIWHVSPLGEFYTCSEDASVYFNPASGNTHLLSNFAAHLLVQLAQEPMDMEQLIDRVASDIDPAELPELRNALPEMLAELAALDVIELR